MLRTPKQRKEICSDCPVARVADVVGDTVSLLILRDLLKKPQRFSELEASLAGVSSRTLTLKLKKLENDGLVSREKSTARAGYRVTNKGRALESVMDAMRSYGKKYL